MFIVNESVIAVLCALDKMMQFINIHYVTALITASEKKSSHNVEIICLTHMYPISSLYKKKSYKSHKISQTL